MATIKKRSKAMDLEIEKENGLPDRFTSSPDRITFIEESKKIVPNKKDSSKKGK